ncbi:MAG: YybH family protein [Gemmatimonadales bacterium]
MVASHPTGLPLALVLLLHASGLVRAQTAADSHNIRSVIEAHAVAWNRRDAKAAVAILAPDAVWITSSGTKLRGRAEIEQAHVQWLAADSAAGGSTHAHPVESIAVRFLRPDVAVADLESQFVARRPSPDGKPPAPDRSLLFLVLTKDAGTWRITEVRNTGKPRE